MVPLGRPWWMPAITCRGMRSISGRKETEMWLGLDGGGGIFHASLGLQVAGVAIDARCRGGPRP